MAKREESSMKNGLLLVVGLIGWAAVSTAVAEKKYGPGVTDTEIKMGQTHPYSGPVSGLGTMGKTQLAYFEKVNAEGGINGRKVKLISLDDGYNPARTVEQVRKLVEQEDVLLLFSTNGTPTNSAIHKYVNARKVPHLFIAAGASKWGDPKNYPWTTAFDLPWLHQARVLAKYLLKDYPGAKIGILYQNDDAGRDYLNGLKEGLGNQTAKMIVAEQSYEVTDPTVDQQILSLKASGADTFFNITTPRFAAQAIRKAYDIGWRPRQFLPSVSSSVATVLTPAGLEKSIGVISVAYFKDPSDPQWADTPEMKEWFAFMQKYYPDGNPTDMLNVYGYTSAQTMAYVLKRCANDLTRENVMKQATSIENLELPMLLPGIKINTSSTDYYPLEQMQLMRFDGKRWVRFGEVIGN
jgi:ABC-type branched-subunit amino acid transport system substrate-binding protein